MINEIKYDTETLREAESFLRQYYAETGRTEAELRVRLAEAAEAVRRTGTYAHTKDELVFGAKVAWRNNAKCVGRLFWDSLEVFDERQAKTEDEIAEALFRHIEYATNEGRIRPTLTAFAPRTPEGREIRIWNHQLVRYAGYRTEDGIVGDPASVENDGRGAEAWDGGARARGSTCSR